MEVYQRTPPSEQRWSNQERVLIQHEIAALLKKGAIEECRPTSRQFISKIFLVPKPDGSHRFILNLKQLNEFIATDHFKLEDGKTARQMITRGCFMTSIDLKDAYYLIPIADSDRKFLRFIFEGKLYQFTCLPFGLNVAPYTFTKLLKPVVSRLRERGLLLVLYLDDLLILGDSYGECSKNTQISIELFEKLGFIINDKKSQLIPSTRRKFLGFIYDSETMNIELPEEKIAQTAQKIEKFSKTKSCTIREFAGLIGTLGSSCTALKYGWVHMKIFERAEFLALGKNHGNFDSRILLSDDLQEDFEWWKIHITKAVRSIKPFRADFEISSDASRSGWGAFCEGNRTHGHWNQEEQAHHINYLELLAAWFALKCFAKDRKDCNILLRIDNTTAIAYINKMGGIQNPVLSKLAREIWKWCESSNIYIFASYISSQDNFEADFESRRLEPETEYTLSNSAFREIRNRLGRPEIDLFATRTNAKCRRYISWSRDPASYAVDAFTVDWSQYFFYAFPPFAIVLRVLRKIKDDRARGIVIVPYWPAQVWFPVFTAMLDCEPIYFQPNANLLRSLNRQPHPIWRRITLVAGVLSWKH